MILHTIIDCEDIFFFENHSNLKNEYYPKSDKENDKAEAILLSTDLRDYLKL